MLSTISVTVIIIIIMIFIYSKYDNYNHWLYIMFMALCITIIIINANMLEQGPDFWRWFSFRVCTIVFTQYMQRCFQFKCYYVYALQSNGA